jgi:hypothetical protein
MNSRRLMGTLSPRITPYHIALGIPLCRAAKSTRGWQLRVKMRRTRIEHILSALPQLATEERTFGKRQLRATTGLMHRSKKAPLFGHLVGIRGTDVTEYLAGTARITPP